VLVLAQRQSPSCQLISFIKLSDNLRLSGSKLHFQESIICLLNNAFEAYQPSAGNKLVVLHADQEQEQIKISVVDGGVGFSQDTKQLATQGGVKDDRDSQESMPKLADSAQTDSGQAIKGRSGVGLDFVTNTIQHRFQGQVEVNSQPGKGTTINCYLPLK
jgi:sensor histidine kinase regulating citrate/malate metabolism